MVNPWKSYFVQDNILKDRPFFWGKTEFFKNVFWSRIFSYKNSVNNISVISWWSVLLVEETGGPGENHRPVTSHWQWLLLNPNSNVFQLYHGKNKLIFSERMMISVISWWSVLLVEETGGPWENHRPVTSHCQTLSHNVLSNTSCNEQDSNSQC
jgi:hypothetical protein